MVASLEQVADRLHPLGFTPLTSAAAGQVLKYDFKGIGPRVIDKSGHGNGGWLKPPANPPRRRILSPFPLEMMLVFDGEGDYVKGPVLDIRNQIGIRARVRTTQIEDWGWFVAQPGAFTLAMDNDGRASAGIHQNGSWNYLESPTTRLMNDGEWHVEEMSYDGEELKVAVDGEVRNAMSLTGRIDDSEKALVLMKASRRNTVKGALDTVNIYNRPIL